MESETLPSLCGGMKSSKAIKSNNRKSTNQLMRSILFAVVATNFLKETAKVHRKVPTRSKYHNARNKHDCAGHSLHPKGTPLSWGDLGLVFSLLNAWLYRLSNWMLCCFGFLTTPRCSSFQGSAFSNLTRKLKLTLLWAHKGTILGAFSISPLLFHHSMKPTIHTSYTNRGTVHKEEEGSLKFRICLYWF